MRNKIAERTNTYLLSDAWAIASHQINFSPFDGKVAHQVRMPIDDLVAGQAQRQVHRQGRVILNQIGEQ